MSHVSTLITGYGAPVPVFALGAAQDVVYNATGGSSVETTAFNSQTKAVIIATVSSDVRVSVGKRGSNTATSTSTLVPAPCFIVLQVPQGGSVAVVSNDTNTGNLSVTELYSGN